MTQENGTPADLTRVATLSPLYTQPIAVARALNKQLKPDDLKAEGYKWFRVTAPADDPEHVYLEAWWTKPTVEGALNREAAVSA